jgi:hypothetical protein
MSKFADGAPPAWARMLDASGYQTFVKLIENYFAEKHIPIRLDADEGVIRPSAEVFENTSVFGLQNIAQMCSQTDRDEWRDLIESHFDCIFAASDDSNALRIDVSDFNKVSGRLRSRLYPLSMLNQAVEIIHRPGPEGTLEVVVLDLPTTVRTISRTEARVWRLENEDLFEIGRANLRQSGALKETVVPLQQGVNLHLFAGDSFYAASHALIFNDYAPEQLPHGALVGIPKRDVLLAHFIHDIGAVEAISSMLQAIIGMHRDGPGSLSPNLYWYLNGEFITLPYELADDELSFTPPNDFLELLTDLSDRANLS